jgi:phenylalanyl-tRNA synthetase beta chain
MTAISDMPNLPIRRLETIDEYRGKQVPDDCKSLTYRIVFQQTEKTLTDVEVDGYIELIINNLKSKWDFQLR